MTDDPGRLLWTGVAVLLWLALVVLLPVVRRRFSRELLLQVALLVSAGAIAVVPSALARPGPPGAGTPASRSRTSWWAICPATRQRRPGSRGS